jgi:hypothetical protein
VISPLASSDTPHTAGVGFFVGQVIEDFEDLGEITPTRA